jgi:N-acetylmuramate 1-kinase
MSDRELIKDVLLREKLVRGDCPQLTPLGGDGSDRRFFRVRGADGSGLLVVLPSTTLDRTRARAEARSCYLIGRHLKSCGVPVPEIHGFDESTGIVVFEDLGDTLLHALVVQKCSSGAELAGWYKKAIDGLIRLQVGARQGFDPGFCWDTSRYDLQVMRERESGYFLQAFCRDLLGIEELAAGLIAELDQIAGRAAREDGNFLLHRDYQSRNLMVRGEEIFIIDFQGARFGPLGYDPASLLLDPYAGLPAELQELLLDYYLETVNLHCRVDHEAFRHGFYLLRLQRNMQILGAFAFLFLQRRKPFFRSYLLPGLRTLHDHLQKPAGAAYPCLRELTVESLSLLGEELKRLTTSQKSTNSRRAGTLKQLVTKHGPR